MALLKPYSDAHTIRSIRRAGFYSGIPGKHCRYFKYSGLYFCIDEVRSVTDSNSAHGRVGFLDTAKKELTVRLPRISELKANLRGEFVDINLRDAGVAVVTADEIEYPPRDLIHIGSGIFIPKTAILKL